MLVVVSLREVVQALDLPGEEWTAYLNPATGAIVTVSDDELHLVEGDAYLDALSGFPREFVAQLREIVETNHFLVLPDQFDIHEWDIIRRFAEARPDERQVEELLDAIHGAGAFRLFRATIRRLGIEDEWYRFRTEALEAIAKEWLEANGIAYR